MAPSKETEAEALERRKVEALEKIAWALTMVTHENGASICVTVYTQTGEPIVVKRFSPLD